MLMKKQEKQQQKIKEVLLKILHIVSYVLSLAFIGLMILTGVQSCSKKDNSQHRLYRSSELGLLQQGINNSLMNTDMYFYQCKYKTGDSVSLATQQGLLDYVNSDLSVYSSYSSRVGQFERAISFDDLYIYSYNDSDFIGINRMDIVFDYYQDILGHLGDRNLWYVRLYGFAIHLNNGDAYWTCEKHATDPDNYIYRFDYSQTDNYSNGLYSSTIYQDNLFLNLMYELATTSNFMFNEKINYNAPFGYLGKNPLIPQSKWESLPHLEGATEIVYIDTCNFLCNGKIYNRILLYGQDAYNYYYHFGDNLLQYTLDHSLKFVEFMAFVNRNEDYSTRVWVWSREVTNDYQGKYIIEDNGYWVSALYRNVTLIGATDNDNIAFTQFNSDLDLYNGGINFYNTDSMGIGYAFTLLRQAFGSLVDIMGISILPGLTLGVFIFLPLIATIIVLIFKAVRK